MNYRKSAEIPAEPSQRESVDSYDNPYESKFYHPAGVASSFEAGRVEDIWARLFNHRI